MQVQWWETEHGRQVCAEWYAQEFMCRFGPDHDCPKPGTQLYGYKFRIQFQNKDGSWEDWKK